MEELRILPVSRPINASVSLPGSKSITNRALIMAALANGRSQLNGALFSDDTHYMASALRELGLDVREEKGENRFEIIGNGGRIAVNSADLFVGNAGTAARFLTAYASLGHGVFRVDGVERMRQRPIGDLLDALCTLGVKARSVLNTGCPPVEIQSDGLNGGLCRLRGSASSQYLTALLLIAAYSIDGLTIEIEGELVSKPYVDITLKMMAQWGVNVANEGYTRFVVAGSQSYKAAEYQIEPDASAASYFYAAAAVTGGTVTTLRLGSNSIQGDIKFVDILERMGCKVERNADSISVMGINSLRGVDVDMNDISDTVMTLAAIAPFANSPTTIRNVAHIRSKETDRISAVVTELKKLGVAVEERDDGLKIYPTAHLNPARIETYDDHRIAMSFTITGLRSPGISIRNPGCVAKTFPDFFDWLS